MNENIKVRNIVEIESMYNLIAENLKFPNSF